MNMLNIHAQSKNREIVVYNEFLRSYNKISKKVYGFVEGQEDPSFYYGAIQSLLPSDYSLDLWSVENKNKVLNLYSFFNWDYFSKNRIAFFIDRDLSVFLKTNIPLDFNIYVTDRYSIENECMSRSVCDRVLKEIFNLSSMPHSELESVLDLFEQELSVFRKKMIEIMSWVIYWKRNGHNPCLDNICMDHLFFINSGQLQVKPNPGGFLNVVEYIHQRCTIPHNPTIKIDNISTEFVKNNGHNKFIRGKYELWFLVKFVTSIYSNISNFSSTLASPPKIHVSFSHSNAITFIAPRVSIPDSLKQFINRTYISYIKIELRNKRFILVKLFFTIFRR